jgi:epoxide hydrolase
MEPFTIAVPDAELDDLRRRLEGARWPAEIEGAGWDYGTDQAFLRSVVDRWLGGYDWRATEAEINGWGSFVTDAAGQRVHLLHARSSAADAIPLVLTHGWPGSIVEFLDALPALRERFHVVVVSMPGYGFSGPTRERGVDSAVVAAAVADVMRQLGYDRYVAQGGDWGGIVTRHLGERYAPNVAAIHCNMLFAMPTPGDPDAMVGVSEDELAAFAAAAERIKDGTAYMAQQSTRPHSVGFGLDDSPLGLAGWILEKFHAWCDTREGLPIRTDRLIDNVMLYWIPVRRRPPRASTASPRARVRRRSARGTDGWTSRRATPSIPTSSCRRRGCGRRSATTSCTTPRRSAAVTSLRSSNRSCSRTTSRCSRTSSARRASSERWVQSVPKPDAGRANTSRTIGSKYSSGSVS